MSWKDLVAAPSGKKEEIFELQKVEQDRIKEAETSEDARVPRRLPRQRPPRLPGARQRGVYDADATSVKLAEMEEAARVLNDTKELYELLPVVRHKLISSAAAVQPHVARRPRRGREAQRAGVPVPHARLLPQVGEDNPHRVAAGLGVEASRSCRTCRTSSFCSDLVEASPRFKEWYNLVTPEDEKLPLDYSQLDKTPFKKMLVTRCLRPDRMLTSRGLH